MKEVCKIVLENDIYSKAYSSNEHIVEGSIRSAPKTLFVLALLMLSFFS